MANHQKFLDIAVRLIDKHGRLVEFQTVSTLPKDPAKPWLGSAEAPVVIGEFMGVEVPYKGNDFGEEWSMATGLFKDVASVLLVAGQSVNLEECTLVVDEGHVTKIAWVQRLRPANLTVLYAFGLER